MPAYVGSGPGLGAEEDDDDDNDEDGSGSDSNETGSLGQIIAVLGAWHSCVPKR